MVEHMTLELSIMLHRLCGASQDLQGEGEQCRWDALAKWQHNVDGRFGKFSESLKMTTASVDEVRRMLIALMGAQRRGPSVGSATQTMVNVLATAQELILSDLEHEVPTMDRPPPQFVVVPRTDVVLQASVAQFTLSYDMDIGVEEA